MGACENKRYAKVARAASLYSGRRLPLGFCFFNGEPDQGLDEVEKFGGEPFTRADTCKRSGRGNLDALDTCDLASFRRVADARRSARARKRISSA